MKTKLAIILALASTGAYAQLPGEVPAPAPALAGSAPKLYPSEQGAFKALEVAAQVVESRIVQKGCESISFPLEVHTVVDGSGTAVFGIAPNLVNLTVAFKGSKASNGRWYNVSGGGQLNGLTVTNINGNGSFNIGSTIQELSTEWDATSYVTGTPDHFKGTIIKDYWRLAALQPIPSGDGFFDDVGVPASIVIDYGYQQVTKRNYVQAKYWQQSATWRHDGVNAGTWWLKTRVAPAGQTCVIEVKLAGRDNVESYDEIGTIAVKTVDAGVFAAPKNGG